jgi:hypothetical protein
MATICHKKNFIVSFYNSDGSIVTNHDQKAALLWTAFKGRLGVLEFTSIAYNLATLLSAHDLEGLDEDFSENEIETVIKCLPNSHAQALMDSMAFSLKMLAHSKTRLPQAFQGLLLQQY